MATASSIPSDLGEDNFVCELNRVREHIKKIVCEFIECLKARESKLMKELDSIQTSYHSYRNEILKQKENRIVFEKTIQLLRDDMKYPLLKEKHEHLIEQTENEFKSIKIPEEPKMVYFNCDTGRIYAELNNLCELVESGRVIDYRNKMRDPIVSVGEKGTGMEQLNFPTGVSVENKTGHIYIADQGNHCVKVFTDNGKVLFKFGDSGGKGKMAYPRGLVVSGDRVFISHGNPNKRLFSILIYKLDGNFISKFGKYGTGKLEFIFPLGLTHDESNGDIYITDSGNHRVQIVSKELKFKAQIGKLTNPHDVKLSKFYIYVLDQSNFCLHIYDYNLTELKSGIYKYGGGGMQVVLPCGLFIDEFLNILIADRSSNSLLIFNPQFELVHTIYTATNTAGVCIDSKERVIVTCQSYKDCLQIFA